jgi:nucleoside-diphosphate-sugar epimerase
MNIGVDEIVGIGSCAEYSWLLPGNISELTEISPTSLYGEEKASLFKWLSEKTSKLLWIRPFFVYGPNDHPDKLIQSAITKRATNSVVFIQNPQDYVDYVFVEDVALVTSRLISGNATGVFNVGTGQASSPVEVAQTVGCRFEVAQETSGISDAMHPKLVVANNQKIMEALGKIEWTSLRSGISNMMVSREISKH